MRAGASVYAAKLRALPYGTKVVCYAVKKNGADLWWKIDKNRAEYIAAAYVKEVR